MTENKPQPPGEFIKAELQRRGWTQADFALVVGRHIPIVNEIIEGPGYRERIAKETERKFRWEHKP